MSTRAFGRSRPETPSTTARPGSSVGHRSAGDDGRRRPRWMQSIRRVRPHPREHAVVVPLRDLGAGDLPLAGGKAANLGELIGAGLPVPDGFCVTTAAYRDVSDAAGLTRSSRSWRAGRTRTGRPSSPVARATRIRPHPCPRTWRRPSPPPYRDLGEPVVAVRSSATAEDLPFASFAGQQDTYLNIVGAGRGPRRGPALLGVALDRPRRRRTAPRNGIDHAGTWPRRRRAADGRRRGRRGAVHRQPGDRPATADGRSTPAPGLGEAVVSRRRQPRPLRCGHRDRRSARAAPGRQAAAIRPLPGGGTEHGRAASAGRRLRLRRPGPRAGRARRPGRGALRRAAGHRVGDRRGRARCGSPRPARSPPCSRSRTAARRRDLRVYFCFSLAQGLTGPLTPMGLSAFRVIGSSVARLYGRPPADPVAGPPGVRDAAGAALLRHHARRPQQPGRAAVAPGARRHGGPLGGGAARAVRRSPALGAAAVLAAGGAPARAWWRRAPAFRSRSRRHSSARAAARRRVDRIGARLRSRPPLPASADRAQRLDAVVERCSVTPSPRWCPG